MYLYRCARRGDFDKNCPQAEVITGNNSYSYEKGIEYIHFFRFSKDAEFYFRRNITYIKSSNYHVGYTVLEVSESDVSKYLGYGLYDNEEIKTPIFIDDFEEMNKRKKDYRVVLEYAIPMEVYNSFPKKSFFRVRDEYDDQIYEDIEFYDSIPTELKNDNDYNEYLDIINNLKIKYDWDSSLIGEEIISKYNDRLKEK